MMEIGVFLLLVASGVWVLVGQIRRHNSADRLKFENWRMSDLGFSPAQKRRIAAAAIARGIGQKTMFHDAILRDIEDE